MKKIVVMLLFAVSLISGGERGDAFQKGHDAQTGEEAIKWYKKALSLCREDEKVPKAWAFNNIGFVYVKEGNWNEALEWLEKAVKEDASNHVGWNNLGITYENIGFSKKAKKQKLLLSGAIKNTTTEAAANPETEYLEKALVAYRQCVKLKADEEKYRINKLRVESLLQVK